MILHLVLAMQGNPHKFKDRIMALGQVDALETKTHKWVWEIVTCMRKFISFLPWILEVMAGSTDGEETGLDSDNSSLFDAKQMAS